MADETKCEGRAMADEITEAAEIFQQVAYRMIAPEPRVVLGFLVFDGQYADQNPAFFQHREDAEAWCVATGRTPTGERIEPAYGTFVFDNTVSADPSKWGV